MSAQQLIDLVVANITNNVVTLSQRGWILSLGPPNNAENPNGIAPIGVTSHVQITGWIVATVVVVAVVIILCTVAIAYGIYKRYVHICYANLISIVGAFQKSRYCSKSEKQ